MTALDLDAIERLDATTPTKGDFTAHDFGNVVDLRRSVPALIARIRELEKEIDERTSHHYEHHDEADALLAAVGEQQKRIKALELALYGVAPRFSPADGKSLCWCGDYWREDNGKNNRGVREHEPECVTARALMGLA